MKKIIIEPIQKDSSILVQFSEKYIVSKNLYITVPNTYKAIIFIDEKMCFRIDPCIEKVVIAEAGKDYLNKQIKVAFVLTDYKTELFWGFGNIQVNNDRIKEAYRVGANGRYSVQITDYVKFIKQFGINDDITSDMLREKTISALKSIGISVIGSYFANTEISVFEISSLNNEIRNKFIQELQKEKAFIDNGIKLKDVTLDGFHVNEEDLEIIRNRING